MVHVTTCPLINWFYGFKMYCVHTTILLLPLWRLPITTILLKMLQDGETALFCAAYYGGAAVVKMLVDYGVTVDIQHKV